MKPKINALVVVEGKSDTRKLQQYYDVDTFETSGMGLNDQMIDTLVAASQKRTIIILTDPDMPGEYVRRKIMTAIPQAQHIMVPKKQAISKNKQKVGIEHISSDVLDSLFDQVHLGSRACEAYTTTQMIELGLIGHPDSRKLRHYVASQLRLGEVNGKQFLHRLNAFGIELQTLNLTIQAYKKEQKQ